MNQKLLDIKAIIGDYKSFLGKIFKNISGAGFRLDEFEELDHIAYRVESNEKYEEMKAKLEKFSLNFQEVEISGRPIAVFKLLKPISYNEYKVNCLELPAPREGKFFKEGLEHAEFVIKNTFRDFLRKHKNIDFDMSKIEREINPELVIDFKDCAVKFHAQSLLEIRKM
jgi:uncharacterized protein